MRESRPWLLVGVGLAVVAALAVTLWLFRPGGEPILVEYYRAIDDDTLVIGVFEGSNHEARVTEVRETGDSITIVVREFRQLFRATGGTMSPIELTVELDAPLANRGVFDSHHSVPESD